MAKKEKMSASEKKMAKLKAQQEALEAKERAREEKAEARRRVEEERLEARRLREEERAEAKVTGRRAEKKKEKEYELSYEAFPELKNIKPYEGYTFHSDYFEVDDQFGCVMSFFHREGAKDDFAPFWGLMMLPSGLDKDVTIHRFDQVEKMTQGWIDRHQNKAETVSSIGEEEQGRGGTARERGKARRRAEDLEIIGQELLNGAAYLHVSFRILIKAPTLESLDAAVGHIDRVYKDSMGTVSSAPYFGEQRQELETLFQPMDAKIGKNFYFTSTEYAGNYSIVTHGLEDVTGEYVGKMTGDVNPAAVLFDTDNFEHHVVVAGSGIARTLSKSDWGNGEKGVSLWGSKLALAALMNNHRTVEFVLNGSKILNFCPDLSSITSLIDMNGGSINMFEMFGEEHNEMAVFAAQMQKLKLMAEQGYETTPEDKSIIQGSLEEVATQFYIDNNMWRENAQANRQFLRVVNIPHDNVPMLREFSAYLDQRYSSRVRSTSKDQEALHADNVLHFLFRNMLTTNGDLFDCITTDEIDKAKTNRRVIYDFSSLARRGKGVVMAQFVNVLDFAIQTLEKEDLILIYGAENIEPSVMSYVETEFAHAYSKGVRIAWIYEDVEAMLAGQSMNRFDSADYTILGKMSANMASAYRDALGQAVPSELLNEIANGSDMSYYVRRGFDNVVFNADLMLGIDY